MEESDALDEGSVSEGFGKIIEDVSGAAKDMERIMGKKRRGFLP